MTRFDIRNAVAIGLAMIFVSMSHANTIGNITCGSDNPAGERVVCDYSIIGYKYQRLYDSQFRTGRNPDIEAKVQQEVAACDGLQCVEAVIDKQIAVPAAEPVKTASLPAVTQMEKSGITPEATSNSNVSAAIAVSNEAPKQNSLGAVLFLLFLVALLFWVIFRKRAAPSKGKAPSNEVGWFSLFLTFLASDAVTTPSQEREKIDVTIKPYGRSSSDGYEWDGEFLRPYGMSSSDGWELIEQIFKPYGRSSHEGYEWDGIILKPYGKSSPDGYEWNGKILKPYGKSDSDGYELDGNNMRPYGKSSSDGWEATGTVPAPVWAHVLGLI